MRETELIVRLRNAEVRAANSKELATRAARIAEMDKKEVERLQGLLGANNGKSENSQF